MIIGKEKILQWFDNSKMNYWRIYQYGKTDGGANIIMTSSQDEENTSAATAREELSDALEMLEGRFMIAATAAGKRSPRGDWRVNIELPKRDGYGGGSIQQVNGISKEDVQAQVIAGIEKYKTEVQLATLIKERDELNKRIKELEKNADDPMNVFIGAIKDYLPYLMPQLLGVKPIEKPAMVAGLHVAGNEPIQDTVSPGEAQNLEEANERLTKCIEILASHAPDWLDLLEKICRKVQENPAILNMLRTM